MKKIFLLAFLVFPLTASLFAQKAGESNEKSPLKTDGNAIVITLEGQAKNVEKVMDKAFRKVKTKKEKGFVAIKGQIFSEVSPDMLDYYYKVEKKKDTETKIIFFISKGYDNFLNSKDNPQEIGNATKFLNGLVNQVRTYELELAIEEQTKVVEDALKDQADLEKDQEKLAKDQKKLEKELEDNKKSQEENKKSQEESKKQIDEQKKTLSELQKNLGKVGK